MRDKYKGQTYFEARSNSVQADIDKYSKLVEEVVRTKGMRFEGVKNGYALITVLYQNKINLMYSLGCEPADIRSTFLSMLPYYTEGWTPDNSYFDLIKTLSLAVLLNVKDKKSINLLLEKTIQADYHDRMVCVLAGQLDPSYPQNTQTFLWENTYQPLIAVLESRDTGMLREYLEKQWARIHRTCPWYGTHNSDIYNGYWSFEAGAAAKIARLDDRELCGAAYYPYDLVHTDL